MQFSCFVYNKDNEGVSKSRQQEYNHVQCEAKNSKSQWFHDEDHFSWLLSDIGLVWCQSAIHFLIEDLSALLE